MRRNDPPLNSVPEDGNGISLPRNDPLANMNTKPSPNFHTKTYTAGEDTSRLAAVAKELGLQQARQPRKQVRKRTPYLKTWKNLLTDTGTEDARIRSVYTSHQEYDDQDFFVSAEWTEEEQQAALMAGGADEEALLEDFDPHAAGAGGNLSAAVLGIIKGMVGPAILYLPHGFATAGYAAALPIMIVSTILFLYSSNCLLESWKVQSRLNRIKMLQQQADERTELIRNPKKKRKGPLPLSYPELAYRALGLKGEAVVKTGIALMQSGVCLTYLIFVPQNLNKSIAIITGVDISPNIWLILMVAIQVPLSWLRDIRKLTPTNLLANLLILYGLSVCLVFAFREATTPDNVVSITNVAKNGATITTDNIVATGEEADYNMWQEIVKHFGELKPFADDWVLFIGTSVRAMICFLITCRAEDSTFLFLLVPEVSLSLSCAHAVFYAQNIFVLQVLLFEGSITLLVPLQEAVHTEEQRAQFPAVYQRVILGIICFYAVFGLSCWMAFGPNVRTVLTTSLPENIVATTVQLAYSVAVIFTFPLQNFPALEIATRTFASSLSKYPALSWLTKRNVLSSILVCLLAVVAVCTMESLDKVVSLMGSLLGCPIAFVFPPIIHSQIAPNLSTSRLWGNRIVATLGVGAMVMASFTTLVTW